MKIVRIYKKAYVCPTICRRDHSKQKQCILRCGLCEPNPGSENDGGYILLDVMSIGCGFWAPGKFPARPEVSYPALNILGYL